jgi:hypothetical protein
LLQAVLWRAKCGARRRWRVGGGGGGEERRLSEAAAQPLRIVLPGHHALTMDLHHHVRQKQRPDRGSAKDVRRGLRCEADVGVHEYEQFGEVDVEAHLVESADKHVEERPLAGDVEHVKNLRGKRDWYR